MCVCVCVRGFCTVERDVSSYSISDFCFCEYVCVFTQMKAYRSCSAANWRRRQEQDLEVMRQEGLTLQGPTLGCE